MKQIVMRPQDVVILLKKISPAGRNMNGKELALSLGISQSEVSESLARSQASGLFNSDDSRVNTLALKDFLVYGIKYCFVAVPAGIVRGVPTAVSASPVKERIIGNEEIFVWPDANGTARGQAVAPLYPSVPEASMRDTDLYRLMAIVDTLRLGRVRECEIAMEYLNSYFLDYAEQQR